MQVLIKKLAKSKIEITIEIPSVTFDQFLEKAVLDLGQNLEIKGFRKGRTPREIVEKEIGQTKILTGAVDQAIKEYYPKAILENKIEAISQPEIEVVKIPVWPQISSGRKASANSLIFKAKMAVLPQIELPDYKKIASKIKRKKVFVIEKEVEDALKELRKSRAKLSLKSGPCQKGDFVEISYSSFQLERSKEFKDSFVLGEGHFVPGFEENLIGMENGEEKEFFLIFPKDYFQKDLAEKEVKFKVKMTSVFKMELPEINDQFAKNLGKFKDLLSLKASLKEGINLEKEREEQLRFREEILEKITNSMNWEIPEVLIISERDRLWTEFKKSFSQNSQLSFRGYLTKIKKTEEEIKNSFLKLAQKNVKVFLVLREIAKKEGIKVSDEEVEPEINALLKRYPDFKSAKKNLDLEKLKEYTKERIINEKVFQLLKKLSEVNSCL